MSDVPRGDPILDSLGAELEEGTGQQTLCAYWEHRTAGSSHEVAMERLGRENSEPLGQEFLARREASDVYKKLLPGKLALGYTVFRTALQAWYISTMLFQSLLLAGPGSVTNLVVQHDHQCQALLHTPSMNPILRTSHTVLY